jgi:hypothetical protein
MPERLTNERAINRCFIVLVCLGAAGAAVASTDASTSVAPTGAAAAAAGPIPPLEVAELAVLADGATKKGSLNFQMGDAIHVKLSPGNLPRLQAAAAERKKTLGLSLTGHFLADGLPLVIGTAELVFVPTRNDASKAFWDELWGGRLLTPQTLSVAVGLEDGSTLVTSETNLLMEPL